MSANADVSPITKSIQHGHYFRSQSSYLSLELRRDRKGPVCSMRGNRNIGRSSWTAALWLHHIS